jgi:hypothetical protein
MFTNGFLDQAMPERPTSWGLLGAVLAIPVHPTWQNLTPDSGNGSGGPASQRESPHFGAIPASLADQALNLVPRSGPTTRKGAFPALGGRR